MKRGFSSLVAVLFSIVLTIIVAGTFFYWYSGIQTTNQDLVFNSFSQTQRGIITETELLIDSLYSTEEEADPNGLADFRHTVCNTGKTKIDLEARRSILIKETSSENFICKVDDFSNKCLNSTRVVVAGLSYDNINGDATGTPSLIYTINGSTWFETGGFGEADNVRDLVQYAVESGGAAPENIFTVINTTLNSAKVGYLGWSEDANIWDFRALKTDGSNISGYSLAVDPVTNTLYIGADRSTGLLGAQILKAVKTIQDSIVNISTENVTSLPTDGSVDYDGVYALFSNGSVFLAGTGNISGTVGSSTGVIYRSTSSDWSGLTTPTLPNTYLRINDFEQVNSRIYAATTGIPSDGGSRSDVIYSDNAGVTWSSTAASLSSFLNGEVALLDDPDDTGLEVYSLRSVKTGPTALLQRYDGTSTWSTIKTWADATPYAIAVDNITEYFYVGLRNESTSANGSEIWRSGPNYNDANWTKVYSNTFRGATTALGVFDICNERNPTCVDGCEGTLHPGECTDVRIVLETSTCDLIPKDYECVMLYSALDHGSITKEDWFEFCRNQNPGDQALIDHDAGFGGGTPVVVIPNANRLPSVITATLTSLDPTRNSTEDDLIVSSSAFDPDGDSVTRIFDWRVNHSQTFTDGNMSIAVLNMPFNEFTNTTTNTIRDYSNYKNHGLKYGSPVEKNSTGCGLVPGGNIGGCISFDGTDDYIVVNHTDIGNPQDSFTVTAWIKPDSAKTSGTGYIINKLSGLSGYALSYNFATNKVVGTWYDSGNSIHTVTSSATTSADAWHFVVLRRDEDAEEIELFVDETCSGGSCTSSFFTAQYGSGDIGIGASATGGSKFYGYIDNVVLFNRSFSDEAIDLMYSSSGTPILQQLSSGETKIYDTWQVAVTAVDTETGETQLTNTLDILPIPLSITPLLFSSAHPYFNTSIWNYTAINQSFSDPVGNALTAVYDWRINTSTVPGSSSAVSVATLNMHFETDSTSSVRDYSTFDNTATVTDATWKDASSCSIPASNACYLFDGSGDSITVIDSTAFDMDNISVMLWFNPSVAYSSPPNDVWLVGKDSGSYSDGDWRLAIDDEGKLNFTVSGASLTKSIQSTQSGWGGGSTYAVAAGYNENTDELFMYVGGSTGTKVEETPVSVTSVSFSSNSESVQIGSHPSIGDDFFGHIDGVQVYRRPISFAQFSEIVNYTIPNGYTAVYNFTVSAELKGGDNLSVAVIPNNGEIDGKEKITGLLIGSETAPTSSTPLIESTNITTNNTFQNVTAINQTFVDAEGAPLTTIYDWRTNITTGTIDFPPPPVSIAVVNFPFDTFEPENITGYSTFARNASILGDVQWKPSPNCVSGGCYDFAGGNNDYIKAPMQPHHIGENFTVTLWAKGAGTFDYVIDSSEFGRGFELYYDTTGTPGYAISLKNGTVSKNLDLKAITAETSTYQFIAFSNNNRTGEVKLYINGTLINSSSWIFDPYYTSILDLRIGGLQPCAGNCWDGQIDELRIFNRTLSDEQVSAMYDVATHSPIYNITHKEETIARENWTVAVTPNDGQLDGKTRNASILITGNEPVKHDTPSLNATTTSNLTNDNLTVYNVSFRDFEGDPMIAIYDWRTNTSGNRANISIAVLNMPFDTNVSNTRTGAVKDYSTHKNNGTLSGGSATPRWRNSTTCGLAEGGGCYDFDGNDIITIADSDFSQPGNWTLVTWFNPSLDSGAGSTDTFISKTDTGTNVGWYLDYSRSSNFVTVYICTGGSCTPLFSSTTITKGSWHMIAVSYRDDTDTAKLYTAGAEVASDTSVGGATYSSNDLILGQKNGGGNPFDGNISSIQIFNRTLSADQIGVMYNGGKPRNSILTGSTTDAGQNYTVAVTPSDGFNDGNTKMTNSLQAENLLQFQGSYLIAIYNAPTHISAIYDWRVNASIGNTNNKSIAVLNMPFNGKYTGTTTKGLTDYSSFKAHGTLGGGTASYVPAWEDPNTCGISDEAGGCYNFDGSNDYISVADADFTQPVNFTVSVWFKRDVTAPCTGADTECGIVSKIDTGAPGGWEIYWDETTARPFFRVCRGGSCTGGNFGCSAPAVGTWQHLVIFVGEDTLGRSHRAAYCDGTLQVSGFSLAAIQHTTTNSLRIGQTSGASSGSKHFDGHIDDVIIFNRSVSYTYGPNPKRHVGIANLYNNGEMNHSINLTNLIPGDIWRVQVYHNDSSRTILSNNLTIT